MKAVQVWFVRGADPDDAIPMLWATKLDAEAYARERFPNESADARYARIFYTQVFSLSPEDKEQHHA